MIEIFIIISVILNVFLLFKQIPIWWEYRKEIQVNKEIEKEIAEIEKEIAEIENTGKANRISYEINSLFLTLKQVKNITILKSADGLNVTVNTILKSKHYNSRQSLYKKQLQIHDMFPEVNIDFSVVFEK